MINGLPEAGDIQTALVLAALSLLGSTSSSHFKRAKVVVMAYLSEQFHP